MMKRLCARRTTYSALFYLILSLALVNCKKDRNEKPLSLQEYADYFNRIILIGQDTQSSKLTSAREEILKVAAGYKQQWDSMRTITPPSELYSTHRGWVQALEDQYRSNKKAGENTPADLPNTVEYINQYSHYWADVGYARDDQAKYGCELKSILLNYSIQVNVIGVCEASGTPPVPDSTAGSSSNPVSYVYMLHDVIRDDSGNIVRPNVDGFQINTIYVKANTSFRVDFDNRNPYPFVFSFSVYKGEAERLASSDFVGGSDAYSGVKVHSVTLSLPAGTYSFVDNVHPIAMRGKLIVMP